MKNFRFLAWAIMAAAAISFSACSDDDTKDKGKDPEPEPELSSECKLTEFKLVLEDKTELQGEIFDFEKTVEVTYTTDKAAQLTSARAVTKISDKATMSPDPNVAADYSKTDAPVKFTVTAEDGKTTATYTVEIKEKVVKAIIKFEQMWVKKAEDGVKIAAGDFVSNDQLVQTSFNTVAASGDKIVLSNLSVYDRTGANVGTLNTDGMGATELISMTNDFNGVLLASVNNPNTTVTDDGGNKKTYEIWIWKNGWNAAPERLINSTNNIAKFISASGDINGECIITAQGAAVEVGPHFSWRSTDGWATTTYQEIKTNLPINDGSWSQMISLASASVDNFVFVFDSESPNVSEKPGNVYMMNNATSEAVAIAGPGAYYPDILGASGWGNFTRGTVRAFTFNDRAYCLAGSTSWNGIYFTVVNPKHPTYEPLYFYSITGIQLTGAGVCAGTAYVEDKADNCAYLYLCGPTFELSCVKVYLEYE